MAAASPSPFMNGGPDHILRPRPVKAMNSLVLRTQSQEGSLKPDGKEHNQASGISRQLTLVVRNPSNN